MEIENAIKFILFLPWGHYAFFRDLKKEIFDDLEKYAFFNVILICFVFLRIILDVEWTRSYDKSKTLQNRSLLKLSNVSSDDFKQT